MHMHSIIDWYIYKETYLNIGIITDTIYLLYRMIMVRLTEEFGVPLGCRQYPTISDPSIR